MGWGGADYCPLVETLPCASDIGLAGTLAVDKNGRVLVVVCNPHPHNLSLKWVPDAGEAASRKLS